MFKGSFIEVSPGIFAVGCVEPYVIDDLIVNGLLLDFHKRFSNSLEEADAFLQENGFPCIRPLNPEDEAQSSAPPLNWLMVSWQNIALITSRDLESENA